MAIEVFVDESCRGGEYLLAAVTVDARSVKASRTATRRMLLPGERRMHFSKETASRRRQLLDQIVRLPLSATVLTSQSGDSS